MESSNGVFLIKFLLLYVIQLCLFSCIRVECWKVLWALVLAATTKRYLCVGCATCCSWVLWFGNRRKRKEKKNDAAFATFYVIYIDNTVFDFAAAVNC